MEWLAIGLPQVARGGIGLTYLGARSPTITGLVAGIPSLLVGAGFVAALSYGLGELPELLRTAGLDEADQIATIQALVSSLHDPLATQSLVLGVAGACWSPVASAGP